MYLVQKDEILKYNGAADKKLVASLLKNKQMEDALREEIQLAQELRDEYTKINRTGRQPRGGDKKGNKEERKQQQREDKK